MSNITKALSSVRCATSGLKNSEARAAPNAMDTTSSGRASTLSISTKSRPAAWRITVRTTTDLGLDGVTTSSRCVDAMQFV
ncbi:hypothetical protein HDG34_003140 [Paraburkholderia sp. HC6.4b]|uniref:hypothetical protein n=1 Tax=unclassified Paraburkholderia TaxID=2615204 RepID=UPI0017F66167|nr:MULTISPECIES: hypothetical protein [unclassified Paraburkholderia]MBB5409199.1 hypothetical protein [Paraburkholderia sp. HC6.4b]MBB5450927.1 hypothetical protein [Paraburkholderia sp. Kb1A]